MSQRSAFRAHAAARVAGAARFACRALSLILLLLIPCTSPSQEFRVQISTPRGRAAAPHARDAAKPAPRVVRCGLENYVEGVLAGEASVLRRRAALEAMAVLVRTWALEHRGRHRARGFDFCSLTHCQVYRPPGAAGYPPSIARAVLGTRSRVLEFHGRLADVYFTADCGGVTESAAEVWPDRNLPYLPGVRDPYCAASRHSAWQRTLALDRAAAILRDDLGVSLDGPLRDFTVASRDRSGRARTLVALAGTRFTIDANQFRYAAGRRLGWDTLKSNLYTVERRGDTLVFSGRGLGHGVGLCQAGADAMAGLGASSAEILAHYFPGATVTDGAPETSADPVASSEHFSLAYPDAQRPWVSRTLSQLESWRGALAGHAAPEAERVRVETWATTAEFIRATGQPGWAAGASDGRSIFLQPLQTLAAKGVLESTLRHELTHLTLERLRAEGVPVWFEEGFALYLTGERVGAGAHGPAGGAAGVSLGGALRRPRSQAEMQAAYARAAELVRALAKRRGEAGLWRVLERPSADDLAWLKSEEQKPLVP